MVLWFQIDPKKRPPFEEIESSTSQIYKNLEKDNICLRSGKERRNSTGIKKTVESGNLMEWFLTYASCILYSNFQVSGRVLDSRQRGGGFQSHRRHCVLSLSKTHLSLLSTGSTHEDLPQHNWKFFDWDIKNQIKQTNIFPLGCKIFISVDPRMQWLCSLAMNKSVLESLVWSWTHWYGIKWVPWSILISYGGN